MGNRPNPVDVHLMDTAVGIREVERVFARDGIDEEEQAQLNRLRESHRALSQFRLREQATEAWVKGGEVTDYVVANFRQAGARISAIDAPANVMAFPGGNDPLEAA